MFCTMALERPLTNARTLDDEIEAVMCKVQDDLLRRRAVAWRGVHRLPI